MINTHSLNFRSEHSWCLFSPGNGLDGLDGLSGLSELNNMAEQLKDVRGTGNGTFSKDLKVLGAPGISQVDG